MRALMIGVCLCALACGGAKPATTTGRILVNVDDHGVMLGGHDAIAYGTDHAAVAGTAEHVSSFGGGTYQFASADHKAAFDANPARSAPRYGGYCAYAASQNRLSESDPTVFLIYEGELLVFTNTEFRELFQKDPAGNKRNADQNWPGLVARYGK